MENKRLFTIIIVLFLLLIVFSGCVKKSKVKSDEVSKEIQSEIDELMDLEKEISNDLDSFTSNTEELNKFSDEINSVSQEMEDSE